MVRTALALINQSFSNLLTKIHRRYILWKYGYKDWAVYQRMTDPDIFWRATRILDFYHGYPYVYCIENRNHQAYYWDLAIDGGWRLHQWCEKNCEDKFRFDGHRVRKQTPIGINGVEESEWWVDEIGGGDYIFAAFKSERDFNWFMLKWS